MCAGIGRFGWFFGVFGVCLHVILRLRACGFGVVASWLWFGILLGLLLCCFCCLDLILFVCRLSADAVCVV